MNDLNKIVKKYTGKIKKGWGTCAGRIKEN